MPGSTVLRLQSVDTQGGCRGYVVRPVVDKDSLVGKRMLASKHHFVDASVRLHHAHLITEVESVKVVLNAVTGRVEGAAACPLHHEGVGVAQQAHSVASLAQFQHLVQVALRQLNKVALPATVAALQGDFFARKQAEFLLKLLGSDSTALQLAEDTHLGERVEILRGIGKPSLVKALYGLALVYFKNDPTQVKHDVSDHTFSA